MDERTVWTVGMLRDYLADKQKWPDETVLAMLLHQKRVDGLTSNIFEMIADVGDVPTAGFCILFGVSVKFDGE